MRIVYLHQYYATPEMAGGTRSYEMARRLAAAGHDVQMVTTWRDDTPRVDWFVTENAGVTVHWLPVHYSNHMNFSHRLRAFVKFAVAAAARAISLRGDVIFATSTPLTIAIPGILASRWAGVPLVFEVRDLWPDVPIAMGVLRNSVAIWMARALERLTYKLSARVVALAPGMKDAIAARGTKAEHITVIPNGCDFDLFGAAPSGAKFPGALPDSKYVLYAGTMGLANGVSYISRLAYEIALRVTGTPVQFYLIGDGSERSIAEALAAQLGVLGRSVYFMGTLPKREVARWVASADATIITYDGPEIVFRDSVSNKFFDSIAASKPVIANYSGFASQVAVAAGAGFIVDRDPSLAALQVLRLIADPGLLTEAGARAGELARQHFSRDNQAGELERVLQGAVTDE